MVINNYLTIKLLINKTVITYYNPLGITTNKTTYN